MPRRPSDAPDEEVLDVHAGATLEEAMASAVAALGPDLEVRRARKVRSGVRGLLGQHVYEVLAAPGRAAGQTGAGEPGAEPGRASDGDPVQSAVDRLLERADAQEERGPVDRRDRPGPGSPADAGATGPAGSPAGAGPTAGGPRPPAAPAPSSAAAAARPAAAHGSPAGDAAARVEAAPASTDQPGTSAPQDDPAQDDQGRVAPSAVRLAPPVEGEPQVPAAVPPAATRPPTRPRRVRALPPDVEAPVRLVADPPEAGHRREGVRQRLRGARGRDAPHPDLGVAEHDAPALDAPSAVPSPVPLPVPLPPVTSLGTSLGEAPVPPRPASVAPRPAASVTRRRPPADVLPPYRDEPEAHLRDARPPLRGALRDAARPRGAPAPGAGRSAGPISRTGWSRPVLARLGVPAAVLQALPDDDPTDDLGWLVALTDAIAACVPPPADAGPEHPVVVTGHGLAGALAILEAGCRGATPGSIATGDRTAPATALELALVVHTALTGG